MADVLTDLMNVERDAQKLEREAELKSEKIISSAKEEASELMEKKEAELKKLREDTLAKAREEIEAEKEAIANEAERKLRDIQGISSTKKKEAKELVIKSILTSS